MTPEQMAVQIGLAGYTAYSNSLVGNAAPRVKAYYGRVSMPQIGDLVVETSSFLIRMRDDHQPHQNVGILVKHEIESLTYEEEGLDPQPYMEEAWYIRPLTDPEDAEPVRWTNAMFVAISKDIDDYTTFYDRHR